MASEYCINNEKACGEAAKLIDRGLRWADTVEGHKYWQEVCNRLRVYSEGKLPAKADDVSPAEEPANSLRERFDALIAASETPEEAS